MLQIPSFSSQKESELKKAFLSNTSLVRTILVGKIGKISGDPSLRVGSLTGKFWSHLCQNHSSHLAHRLAFDDVHFPNYDLPSLTYFQGRVRKRPQCFVGSHYASILLEAAEKLHKADSVPLHRGLRTDVGIRLDPSSVKFRGGLNGKKELNIIVNPSDIVTMGIRRKCKNVDILQHVRIVDFS